jgi:hypothetical protein
MNSLPETFLQSLVAWLDDENTVGLALAGSFARGDSGPCSDVDLWHYLRQMSSDLEKSNRLLFRDGYLVSVTTTMLEKDYASLQNPERAIWAIPGLRQARILLDKDGSLAALMEMAEKATWEPLQAAADGYASCQLAGYAEEVHKIMGGLAQQDESRTLYAVWGLTRGLADTLLVQRGVLIPSENAYIALAQDTAGRTSAWARQFRLAIGLAPVPAEEPAFVGYGRAGLGLYRETFTLLKHVLAPEDAAVVERTLEIMAEAGY